MIGYMLGALLLGMATGALIYELLVAEPLRTRIVILRRFL